MNLQYDKRIFADKAMLWNKLKSIVIVFGIGVLVIPGFSFLVNCAGQGLVGSNRSAETLYKKWRGIFGNVDFSDRMLFQRMVYLHPQQRNRFRKFENEILSKSIQTNHDQWVNRFFKGDLLRNIKGARPIGYYLNERRKEPSLLLFEVEFNNRKISLVENYNLVFLTVKPKNIETVKSISEEEVNLILTDWTNITVGREEDALKDFSLPEVLNNGYVFANNGGRRIQRIQDWRDDIVGFVTNRGICFMLFKIDPKAIRAERGLSYDFNWLNKGLFKEDGKTLLSPEE